MSLDVYLTKRNTCPNCNHAIEGDEEVYSANITHNLGAMAKAAGIYEALWRPEEIGKELAGDLVPLLEHGLKCLKANPSVFKKHNSPNGWGMYEHFVPFVENYLDACREHPYASIHVSR